MSNRVLLECINAVSFGKKIALEKKDDEVWLVDKTNSLDLLKLDKEEIKYYTQTHGVPVAEGS